MSMHSIMFLLIFSGEIRNFLQLDDGCRAADYNMRAITTNNDSISKQLQGSQLKVLNTSLFVYFAVSSNFITFTLFKDLSGRKVNSDTVGVHK
jgi:hypothetical protein